MLGAIERLKRKWRAEQEMSFGNWLIIQDDMLSKVRITLKIPIQFQ